MTNEHAIEAFGLVKRYGEKAALGGVDIVVPTGTVTAVLGPNGAGKTTAVRILSTLSVPTEGTATVAGFDVTTHPTEVRRRIGLAAQDATVDPLLTGHENLVMIGELHQLPRKQAKARATELLDQFALSDASSKVASAFSGGMRRRLDLAATLVARPQVLFLDEPTTGLDPRARNDLWEVLETLLGEGVTILLTTQYLEEADRLADDILVVDHGKVIAQGDARSLKRQVGGDNIGVTISDSSRLDDVVEILRRVTGADPIVDRPARTATAPTTGGVAGLAAVANALAEADQEVEDLSLRQPTLDEVFLTLTGLPLDGDDDPEPTPRTPEEVTR
ncbi:ATP-binding cassette domain-containing protein [Aquihabitans sp. G128]|uniref:ATP-binding cassette domain-containing protein n=1 Tax=Aquihabitans sp. G128 TaxID=2849779 RepID=UPI001C242AA3|nr:ATP-binding cassette domain-containing protein [Aquihabitans sp. G128]QXC59842.1 ATP-binding cassette domain-containing protein [Aquihabitans sp. G128]